MSREIKFRAWNEKTKRFTKDSYNAYLSRNDDGIVTEQYTGLTDKNDKEIYEGDIVDIHDGVTFLDSMRNRHDSSFGVGEVVWGWGGFWARPLKGGQYASMAEFVMGKKDCKHVEIIGNVHENPELLGGKK